MIYYIIFSDRVIILCTLYTVQLKRRYTPEEARQWTSETSTEQQLILKLDMTHSNPDELSNLKVFCVQLL